jgi:hypothetical protein
MGQMKDAVIDAATAPPTTTLLPGMLAISVRPEKAIVGMITEADEDQNGMAVIIDFDDQTSQVPISSLRCPSENSSIARWCRSVWDLTAGGTISQYSLQLFAPKWRDFYAMACEKAASWEGDEVLTAEKLFVRLCRSVHVGRLASMPLDRNRLPITPGVRVRYADLMGLTQEGLVMMVGTEGKVGVNGHIISGDQCEILNPDPAWPTVPETHAANQMPF